MGRHTVLVSLAALSISLASAQNLTCTGKFDKTSAADYIKVINPGWNLGNTLDAVPNEGSWNNPPAQASVFDDIKAAGFKSVRIPVTYTDHFASQGPDYKVDEKWLQRVEDVVDMALARGLYVMTNVHHDSWNWADVTKAENDWNVLQDKFYKLWVQIGTKLGCKSSKVSFEPINEPPATTAEHGAKINTLNDIFIKALADSGGFNTDRVITLSGGGMDSTKTTQWFKPPAKLVNPWALQYHFYSPYDFIFGAWGKTIWGSDVDKALVGAELGWVPGNFTGVPLVIGEFDASPRNTEPAARWKYYDHFTRVTKQINAAIMLWENGLDHLDRAAHKWRDPTSVNIIKKVLEGKKNSLPDSTVDGSVTQQSSSAYIFHRVGEDVKDQTLPWLFNGNTLKSITQENGKKLALNKDYTVSSSSITFKSSFLSRHVTKTSAAGVHETLKLSFSAGTDVLVQMVQWDKPVLGATSSTAKAGSDLLIPVQWKGTPTLAAVKVVKKDGTYLVDDWTQYLPTLQQGRATFDGQWAFEGNNVVLRAAIVDMVIASGQETTFTFEFYPRTEANTVQYTLKP